MEKLGIALIAIVLIGGATGVIADNATMHGHDLKREGTAIHMQDFDITLDGRTLTASEGVYHVDTGIVDLKGNVQLHFGPQAQTFPGEAK